MSACLTKLTLREAVHHLEAGECGSLELVDALLASIAERDPLIRGYLHLDPEQAREEARAADQARAAGRRGRLLGVPIAVKDVLNVRGQPCTCGSRILRGYRAPYDATVIARLRAEGAIFLGRTNMDEFAMGSTTENSAVGPTRNPWNLERVPGGSSGGSAAVVAADEALAALGSDTGGSVRQPAAFCGCTGLKPTYGLLSRYGLVAYASSLDQVGTLTKDVADAALLLTIMAGRDPRDSTSLDVPPTDYTEALIPDLRGIRLGLPKEYFEEAIEAGVKRAIESALEVFCALGAEVREVTLPHTPLAIPTYYLISCAEASTNLARYDGVRYGYRTPDAADVDTLHERTRAEGFGREVKRRIILGTYALSRGYYEAYYGRAQRVRTLIRRDFEAAFHSCDALVAPTTPTAAYRLGERLDDPLQMYLGDIFTVTANLAGIGGLTIPCGFTPEGLPVGLQILAPALGERVLIRVGHAYQSVTEWHRRRPPLAAGGGRP